MARFSAYGVLLLLGVLAPQTTIAGDIYSWEDANGVHFVDSLENVPKEYRSKVIERAQSGQLVGDGDGSFNVMTSGPNALVPGASSPTGGSSGGVTSRGRGKAATDTGLPGTGGTVLAGEALDPDALAARASKGRDKAFWQARKREWHAYQATTVEELKATETEIYRVRTLTPAGFQQTLVTLDEKKTKLEADIERAQTMLDEVIPREARQEGVPPGWLR